MSDDDKELKDEGEDGEKTGGAVLSDSVLDAFDEAIPVEDETLKDPFDETSEEEDPIPLDSGDYGTSDEW